METEAVAPKYPNAVVELLGRERMTLAAIISDTTAALHKAGATSEEITLFCQEALGEITSVDQDRVLQAVMRWVDVGVARQPLKL